MRTMAGGACGESDLRMNEHEFSRKAAMRRIGAILMMCAMAGGAAEGAAGAASSQPATSTPAIQLDISEPVIVAQGPAELSRGAAGWGRWQFPYLRPLGGGRLAVWFSVEPDSVESYGKPVAWAMSSDTGRTWQMQPNKPASEIEEGALLPNGERLRAVQQCAVSARGLTLPKPVCEFTCSFGNAWAAYPADAVPATLTTWVFERLPAGGTSWKRETPAMTIPGRLCTVVTEQANVPGLSGEREGKVVLPVLQGKMRVAPDGSLWAVTYDWRLQGGRARYVPVFLRSTDGGHAWRLQGVVPYSSDVTIDPQAETRDGFTEPDYEFMPDGSIICLMRTSDGCGVGPLLLVRSTDGAQTWSKPACFDTFGKMPQLMTLRNGTTLASYGQSGGPGYFVVRATCDPAGLTWSEPAKLAYSPRDGDAWDTCGHTEMAPLDEHTALIVYSDFNTPDGQGVKRKTILVRRIVTNRDPAAGE